MALTRPRAHQLSGVSAKSAVRILSSSNVTLSGGTPATVDGVSLTIDDRILVTGQTSASENGLYRCTVVGSGSNGTWIRSRDGSHQGTIVAGMTCMVTEGSTYADTLWKLTTDGVITIDSTALTFEQHSSIDSSSVDALADVTLTSTATNDLLQYNGSQWVNSSSIDISGDITVSGDLDIDDDDSVFLHGDTGFVNKRYVLYGTTTDDSVTEIFVGGTTDSRVSISTDTTMFYTVDIVARRTDATGESAGWQLKGVADNFSGTTADVGTVYEVAVARDDIDWTVDALAGDTEDAVVVTCQGATGKTIKWMAVVKTMEITN